MWEVVNSVEELTPRPARGATREKIALLEHTIRNTEGSLGEDPFPLEHTFAPGLYARQITVPAGYVVVTKIHKAEHLIFMLKGRVSVVTEHGAHEIVAPCMFKSPAGAKRAVYVHEETVWINVHANPADDSDLKVLEDKLIAKSYAELELGEPVSEVLELKEA